MSSINFCAVRSFRSAYVLSSIPPCVRDQPADQAALYIDQTNRKRLPVNYRQESGRMIPAPHRRIFRSAFNIGRDHQKEPESEKKLVFGSDEDPHAGRRLRQVREKLGANIQLAFQCRSRDLIRSRDRVGHRLRAGFRRPRTTLVVRCVSPSRSVQIANPTDLRQARRQANRFPGVRVAISTGDPRCQAPTRVRPSGHRVDENFRAASRYRRMASGRVAA